MATSGSAGLVRRAWHGLARRWQRLLVYFAGRLGRYDHWRSVDWSRVQRLVFVCSGNICRSPFAEKLALARGVAAISCGTTAKGGALADPSATKMAKAFRVDLSNHVSKKVSDVTLSNSDLVVVMDLHHAESVQALVQRADAQLTLLGLWDRAHPVIISDPFGSPLADFDACFKRIDDCMNGMLDSRNN